MKDLIENIDNLCRTKYAKIISIYDDTFLEQSVKSRMNLSNCNNYRDYYILIKSSESESSAFLNSLNNSYSEFFRNPLTFALIEQYILPTIFRPKINTSFPELRIWSAGCSSGQEPYSLAILCEDIIQEMSGNITYRIFATDLSINGLFSAKLGNYDYNAIKNIRLRHLNNYFTLANDSYSITQEIKKNVDFSYYDLLDTGSSAPAASIYGDFDLVICCNLLFYYKPDIQHFILSKIKQSLKQGGYLIVSEAESAIVKANKEFKQFVSIAPVFVKI
jgi:chemotaxis methyl-accepting protein methylase